MAVIPPIAAAVIEQFSRSVGDTASGFTGVEIGRLLADCHIPDPGEMTKWRRIDSALRTEQARTGSGNCVVVLAREALRPVRWIGNRQGFADMRAHVNYALAFCGIEIGPDGEARQREVATTHEAAATISRRMREKLQERRGHAEVFRYCAPELVADDCFGAVFEAVKGLAERIRQMTGLDADGHDLVTRAFEGRMPMLAFNTLQTDTERNEQAGLANVMKGIFSAFRNPAAHEPKVQWHIPEDDALDLLSMLSLLHRRLDRSAVVRTT